MMIRPLVICSISLAWFLLQCRAVTSGHNHLIELRQFPRNLSAHNLERRDSALGFLRGLGADFAAAITIGTDSYNLVIDAGSYYTWLVVEPFFCHDSSGSTLPPWECGYAKALSATPDVSVPSNSPFSAGYADGDGAIGRNGLAHISLNGLQVKQPIGLVSNVSRAQVPNTSGILGLSLSPPGLAMVFPGLSSALVENVFTQNLKSSMFQLAITRQTSSQSLYGGLLNFGQWPSIADKLVGVQGPTASTPLLANSSFYNITIDGIAVNGKPLSSSTPEDRRHYIIDSGTLLNYLPEPVAAQLNRLLHPSAHLKDGSWLIDCDAGRHMKTSVGFRIGGHVFTLASEDMVYQISPGVCATSFQSLGDTGGSLNILGQQFLKNVWVEFDWGEGFVKMRGRV